MRTKEQEQDKEQKIAESNLAVEEQESNPEISTPTWYTVVFEAGTFMRDVPAKRAKDIGELNHGDHIQCTGKIHTDTSEGGLTYMEVISPQNAWVPIYSKHGATVIEERC
jgi:hypothetical protein